MERPCLAEDKTTAIFDQVRQYVRRVVDANGARKWLKASTVASIERFAAADRLYAVQVDYFDDDDWLLNTPGCAVDLRTGELRPNNPDDRCTKVTAVAHGGECPRWRAFLRDVTGGDDAYAAFLQRVVGYGLTGSTREHALFFWFGSGINGKSTFLNTIQRVLGDYATVAPIESFTETHTDRHPTDLAMLRGARMVFAQETEEGRVGRVED